MLTPPNVDDLIKNLPAQTQQQIRDKIATAVTQIVLDAVKEALARPTPYVNNTADVQPATTKRTLKRFPRKETLAYFAAVERAVLGLFNQHSRDTVFTIPHMRKKLGYRDGTDRFGTAMRWLRRWNMVDTLETVTPGVHKASSYHYFPTARGWARIAELFGPQSVEATTPAATTAVSCGTPVGLA